MKVLVTGGGGFLGKAIIERLVARGDQVRSLARGDYPELAAMGCTVFRGDVATYEAVAAATQGVDAVIHTAAKAGIWGRSLDFERTNVRGTENVIRACREFGVSRLVHTSSPSVVFDGRDMVGVDESVPYPARYEADYPRTKAIAEQAVLAAKDDHLATVALRPHLIWGPGDHHLVPRILQRGRTGQLRRVGSGNPLIDTIYIDNAAHAHVLALDRLHVGCPLAGKVYFLSQGVPIPLWDMVNAILAAGGLPPVTRRVPKPVALAAATVLEGVYRLLNWEAEPRLTRFLVQELSTAHWFNITAARRDLDYAPQVSTEEGLQRLRASLAASAAAP
jgi:nucleoside-diphosphate-sugar epimerase